MKRNDLAVNTQYKSVFGRRSSCVYVVTSSVSTDLNRSFTVSLLISHTGYLTWFGCITRNTEKKNYIQKTTKETLLQSYYLLCLVELFYCEVPCTDKGWAMRAGHAETTAVLWIRPAAYASACWFTPTDEAFPAISSEPLIWLNRRGITRVGWCRGRWLQMVHSSDPSGRTTDVSGPPSGRHVLIRCALHNTHTHTCTRTHKYRLVQLNLFMTDLLWERSSVYSAVKSDLRLLNNRNRC